MKNKAFIIVTLLLTISIKNLYSDHASDADKYYNQANSFKINYNYSMAAAYFIKAAEEEEKNDKPRDNLIINALNEAGTMYYYMADYQEALKYYKKGLETSKYYSNIQGMSNGYGNTAMIYNMLRDYENALIYYKKSLDIAIELNLPEHILVSYLNIGIALTSLYRLEEAMETYKQAEELIKTYNYDKYSPMLNNYYGYVYRMWGKFDLAIEYYLKAKDIFEQINDKNNIIVSLVYIGDIYLNWAKYDTALLNYQDALTLSRNINYKIYLPYILNNIGRCYQFSLKYKKAEAFYQESIKEAEQLDKPVEVARALNSLGILYLEQLRDIKTNDKALELDFLKKADNYFDEAYQIFKANNIKGDMAQAIIHKGAIYHIIGEYKEAITNYNKAIEITEETGNTVDRAVSYDNLGSIYYLMNDIKKAIDNYKKSVDLKEELRKTAKGTAKRDYLASQFKTYQRLITAYVLDNDLKKAIEALEISKSKYLIEQISEKLNIKDFQFSGIKNIQNSLDKDTAIVIYTNIIFDQPIILVIDKKNISCEISKFNYLYKKFQNKYEKEIEKNYDNLRGLEKKKNIDITDVQVYENRLTGIINYYRSLISSPSTTKAKKEKIIDIAKTLYTLLLSKVENKINNKKNLIIIPDDILGYLPFETLILPDNRYLIEKYNIKYAQSLSVYELIGGRNYNNYKNDIIAFGGADYQNNENIKTTEIVSNEKQLNYLIKTTLEKIKTRSNLRNEYQALGLTIWKDLPGTLQEVKEIKNIFKKAIIYTGDRVNEELIKKLSKNGEFKKNKVIHFSTHGTVVQEIPELSSLILSQNINDSKEDGFLNMKEISELIINADFINLSACETGLGKIYTGEGIVGLTQSFLIAGANGLSVSLWQVADESTKDFMVEMYRLVKENKMTYYEAINEVKRKFIKNKKYSDPFYWAPFIYYGK